MVSILRRLSGSHVTPPASSDSNGDQKKKHGSKGKSPEDEDDSGGTTVADDSITTSNNNSGMVSLLQDEDTTSNVGTAQTPQIPPAEIDHEPPFEPEPNDWHLVVEDEEWDKLEDMIKKYDVKYHKRVREKVEREKARVEVWKQQERERLAAVDSEDSSTKSPASGRRSSLIGVLSPAGRRAQESPIRPTNPSPFRKSKLQSMYVRSPLVAGRYYNNDEQPLPLMAQDQDGRTPLHLACLLGCPDKILLDLLVLERRAASVADQQGQLVLHAAVGTGRYSHIVETLVKAHPNALKTKDREGRSPIALAVELAEAERAQYEDPNMEDTDRIWSHCFTKPQRQFQIRLDKCWTRVDGVVQTLEKRKKSLIPSEHGLLLDALKAGAPPRLIARLLSTTAKFLIHDDELAGKAIALVVRRQYPLGVLQQLLRSSRERTTIVADALHKSLIAHYQDGCHVKYADVVPFGKEIIDWAKERNSRRDAEGNLPDGEDEVDHMAGVTKAGIEWWEKLQYLIAYAAYGKDYTKNKAIKEQHLLHACLATAVSPPSLVSLLLMVYPQARSQACPVYKALPIHLACGRWKYDVMQLKKDNDHKVTGRVMKQLLSGEVNDTLLVRHRRRLPLHMALASGQSWSVANVLIRKDQPSIGMRDPNTKLFPFQLAAVKLPAKNRALMLRMLYNPSEWRNVPANEKRQEIERIEGIQLRRQVGTIFEMLRSYPPALQGRVRSRESTKRGRKATTKKKFKELAGVGPVAAHYLAWCYKQQRGRKEKGDTGWVVRPTNVKVLRDAVMEGVIPKNLEPWWKRLKHFIWHCYPGEKESLPRKDEYLLHAALYNADTPPLVIELLLQLYPASVTFSVPETQIYPLHIAAATMTYTPQPFEIPTAMDALQLTCMAYPRATKIEALGGRLPLHTAIARGKTWKELAPLIETAPRTLLVPDPLSGRRGEGLLPFQLMAAGIMHSREQRLRLCRSAERRLQNIDLEEISSRERGLLLRKVLQGYHAEILTSIYGLLRRCPDAIVQKMGSQSPPPRANLMSPLPKPSKHVGIASTLEEYLAGVDTDDIASLSSHTPPRSISPKPNQRSMSFADAPPLDTPEPPRRKKQDLASFLGTPERPDMQRAVPSLSSFLGTPGGSRKGHGSMTEIFDSSGRVSYNDDLMSSMGNSATSASLIMSPVPGGHGGSRPDSVTRGGNRPPLRGKRSGVSFQVPDLG